MDVKNFTKHTVEISTGQYGAYETSFDEYPDERRWAKRFALRRLRDLLQLKHADGRFFVQNFHVIEHEWKDIEAELFGKYTYGWKCQFILANK